MTMNMKMVTRPGIFLRRQELISQLVWQGTGHHPAVFEKLTSQFEVLCNFNEVVVYLFGTRFKNGFVSR